MTFTINSVALQTSISISNLALYFVLVSRLDDSNFVVFSSAVSVSIMAYAIAESGISYVAPLVLAKSYLTRKAFNSAFMLLSVLLYSLTFFLFYIAWKFFSDVGPSFTWAFSYALYFLPVMLVPAWSTCWYLSLTDFLIVVAGRLVLMFTVMSSPTPEVLGNASLLYIAFLFLFLFHVDSRNDIFAAPRLKHFRVVIFRIREVFFAKTATYLVYTSIPLLVSAIFGATESAMYLLGERLKSTYASLFQPIIQVLFLRQSKLNNSRRVTNKWLIAIGGLNLFCCIIVAVSAIQFPNLLVTLGFSRLANLNFIALYVAAACFSVFSSCLLFFKVLPSGSFKIFQSAVYFQTIIFLALFLLAWIFEALSPVVILFVGELALLVYLCTRKV